jgi:hypothetical protein
VFAGEVSGHVDDASALLRAAAALPACLPAHQEEKEFEFMLTKV